MLVEEAFLTAIGIAQQQKARSFELRAALSLAKLYQSSGRAADAHAVLAPALAGFSPTPEFPEIEQAQTLLAALAETDEAKNAAAARQRRLKLQTSYGQAMLHARGYSAPETTAAFAHARELTAGIENPAERFSVYFGLWAGSFVRGDLAATREITDIMLTETKDRPDLAGGLHRNSSSTATPWWPPGISSWRAISSNARSPCLSGTGRRSRPSFRPGCWRCHNGLPGPGPSGRWAISIARTESSRR